MKRTGIVTVLVALLVVLAGCAGGAGTLTDSPQSNDATGTTTASGDASGDTGTVNFYVSDEENAIENFEHLNVTIERVTFVRADSGGDDAAEAEDDTEDDSETSDDDEEANVSAEANATANVTANGTLTAENESEVEAEAQADADAEAKADAEESDADDESDDAEESDDESESDDAGERVTYDVENVTVDLTELKGDNASLVDAYDVPKGDYNAVHIEVSNVSGTLKSGEQVNLKLPSNKLKLNSGFTVEKGGSTDFVFDITAFEAGQSGKYILKPVIGESGTNVKITKVDDDRDESEEKEDEADDEDEAEHESEDAEHDSEDAEDGSHSDVEADESADLNVTVDGNLTAGENVTLTVTQNGSAVENATVTVNDEEVGTTDADGTLVVELPHVKEVDMKVTQGDAEAEFEFDLVAELTESGGDDSKKPDNPGKSDTDDD